MMMMAATMILNPIPNSTSIFVHPLSHHSKHINFPVPSHRPTPTPTPIQCSCAPNHNPTVSASTSSPQIEMFLNTTTGVYSPRDQKVVVLWDLDNKPPRGPPFPAALSLRRVAELFGRVLSISAYANRHAFTHLPSWVLHQRRQQRNHDVLERKGLTLPSQHYVCSVCGRKCKTNLDLKKHFKQLHQREREKKLARMRSLKGKKRQKYKERFISNNVKYEDAARQLLTPKTGYGLAAELRRAGVFVKTVEDKPQAADWALKRQMQHSMSRGVDWLVLVSDDSDFSEMVRRARESDLRTVVVGDGRTALARHADLWVPWMRVESGEVGDEVLRSGRRNAGWNHEGGGDDEGEVGDGSFLSASFYEGGDVDVELEDMADEIVVRSSAGFGCSVGGGSKSLAFSEEEAVDGMNLGEDFGDDIFGSEPHGGDFLSDSEDDDDYYI